MTPTPVSEAQLAFLAGLNSSQIRFRDDFATAAVITENQESVGYLVFTSSEAAGAIGKAQGSALLAALNSLKRDFLKSDRPKPNGPTRLIVWINAAGAHFNEPLEGLAYLNAFIEALWQWREKGIRIEAHCDTWLYGGAAMAIAAAAHEVVLGPAARMGLFGHRVTGSTEHPVIPAPPHNPPD